MTARVKGSLAALLLLTIIGAISWVIAGLAFDFDPASQPIGYVGQPGVSSHKLYTGNAGTTVNTDSTRLYAIDYDATDWSGNLHSYPLTSAGAIVKTDDWPNGAAAVIDVQNPTNTNAVPGGRYIVTRNGSTGIAFRWSGTSTLSTEQKTALDPLTATSGRNIPTTSPVLDYIRGLRSNEGTGTGKYRVRGSVLGDMIHSTPVYCAATAPATAPSCTASTIFVGANDGMLHAINAATGSERFAYIPSMLIPKLGALTSQSYEHQYYVDGRMHIRKFGNQTILAGALGSGGQGLFALDVTNAAATSETDAAAKILWEISHASTAGCNGGTLCYANLGYTYGQPVLITLADGTAALIVGNGYANGGNGKASLFLINALTGALIREILSTDAGSTSNRNGLSSPTILPDSTGRAAYAYAGDLDGNLWKFQLTSPYKVTKLHTVSPAQAINMPPELVEHPSGTGYIVTFVTGRMLIPSDSSDSSRHFAYGIWDSAPNGNTTLLSQTLTESTYTGVTPSIRVRTVTSNSPNWGAGGHKGWRTELPIDGERVVGDGAFASGSVFIFLSTNPTVSSTPPEPSGENWWMQISAFTGGDNGSIRFDLDGSGSFGAGDQVSVDGVGTSPVGRHMGGGVRSQLTVLNANSFNVYQANYDKNAGVPPSGDPGISAGHFDYDIYYYNGETANETLPTGNTSTGNSPFCAKTTNITNELGGLSPTYCNTTNAAKNGYPANYGYLTQMVTGAACGSNKAKTNLQTITCSEYSTVTTNQGYTKQTHVHEYDDKYDVTGVNMLAASDSAFNLSNAIAGTSTAFKILVMNQYVNPAAKLAVGPGASEVSVKTYGGLASQTDQSALLAALPVYSRSNIGNFVFNLPKTAFQSKDWWGDGSIRAGLIPTQTGCVNKVTGTGTAIQPGPNGERANGALTIQLIKSDTPSSALRINGNGNDVKYGWRVKDELFTTYVLAEYTAFWHHPNGKCFHDAGWVPNPPQDPSSDAAARTPAVGSSDPKGVFGGPGTPGGSTTVVSTTVNKDGSITTTYSDGTVIILYPDGSTKTTSPDGKESWVIPGVDPGGVVIRSVADPGGVTSPSEVPGRINWREVRK